MLVRPDAHAFIADLDTRRLSAPFHVLWDVGGRRVALTEDGDVCITGTYSKGGLAGYALPAGELLWHRRELRAVQRLSYDLRRRICIVERRGTRAVGVDPLTGELSSTELPRLEEFAASPYDDLWLLDADNLEVVRAPEQEVLFRIERKSFAVLRACFSPTMVFVSEAADALRGTSGTLRGFELKSGRSLWEIQCENGHWLTVAYSVEGTCLYGLRRTAKGTCALYLDHIEPSDGRRAGTVEITKWGPLGEFVRDATQALFLSGMVMDTAKVVPLFWIRDETDMHNGDP